LYKNYYYSRKSKTTNFEIDFERETESEHDENAIKVLIVESSSNNGSHIATIDGLDEKLNSNTTTPATIKIKIGDVAKGQAEILAPLLDRGFLRWVDDEGNKNNIIEIRSRCF
jgi:hypothetical protein